MPNDKPQKPYLYRDNYKNNSFPARAARAALRTADTGIYDLLHFFPNVIAKSYNYVTGRPDISVFQSVNDDNYYRALDAMRTPPKYATTSYWDDLAARLGSPQEVDHYSMKSGQLRSARNGTLGFPLASQNTSSKPKTVSELWREITGLNWSEAKNLGLTDGSYSKNIQLMRDLKSGKITKSSINSMREALAQSASIPESERIVITPERVGRELSFEDVPSPIDAGAEHDEFLFTPEEREKIGELYNSFDRMSDREWQRNERYADRMDRRDARRSARQARRDQTIRNFDPYAEGYTMQDVISPYL